MKLTPRPYQSRILDELWSWFASHQEGHPVVEACVGAGKSMLIAMLAQRAMLEYPGTRILVVVPSKELLVQNIAELFNVWPEADIGAYSAAIGKKQLGHALTYATIGSVYKDAHKLGRIDMILADEAHLISTKDTGMWRKLISDLQKFGSPGVRVVGWTGTPYRGNGYWITSGEAPLFTHIAARATMRELLDAGFLAPLTTVETKTHVDASEVKVVGGDYVVSELARVTDRDELVQATCDEVVVLGAARKKWLAFCVTVDHAEHVCAALQARGIAAAVVTGETPAGERDARIAAFRAGRLRCLVNVAVLTTGFNVKDVDFIILLRATKSPVLYTQIMGRGLRTETGKTDCLVADFTDTILTLGPVDAIKGRVPTGGRKGEAPTKLCPECGNPNPTAAPTCRECGFEFPPPERIKHGAQASAAAVLSSQVETMIETVPVDTVQYRLHQKEGSPLSLRVDYYAGMLRAASEWVCVSHSGYARVRAEQWWQQRTKIDAIPGSTEEALEWLEYDQNILRVPAALILNKQSKYPTIVGFEWEK